MTDRFSGTYDIDIDASVHTVFEHLRDPRRVFAGEFDFIDVTLTLEGVGTTAHGRTLGSGTEEMTLEYVEFLPDQRIVFKIDPTMTIPKVRRVITFPTHILTWTFAPHDGGTRLTLTIVEQDPPWWERLLDVVGQRSWGRLVRARLARIKAAAEEQAVSGH